MQVMSKPTAKSAAPRTHKKAARAALTRSNDRVDVAALRAAYGLTRPAFARLLGLSERKLIDLENERGPLKPTVARRLRETERLRDALATVMEPADIGTWMQQPNRFFAELKPLEVVERGEVDRLWSAFHVLATGEPLL
jgi:DNA-binding transcriptional regulator YiaG